MGINDIETEIRQATDYQRNKQLLREQVQTDLLFSHSDGLFRASPELISFLSVWDQDELFLEDEYHNPVRCNRHDMLDQCRRHYQKILNHWHSEHEQLQKIRKI